MFGAFVTHNPESCPLNNKPNKKIFMQFENKMKTNMKKHKIKKILGFYMSALEHLWVIILEAESAHDIENLCLETGIASFNTVKIVPMNTLEGVMRKLKQFS
jgi:hypothetical protein